MTIIFLNFKNIKRCNFQFQQNLLKTPVKFSIFRKNVNFFTGTFQGFCLLFRNIYLLKGTPLSYCFRSFQQAGFTREYIFTRKKLLPGVFKCESSTPQTISRGALISWRTYFQEILFSGEYLLTVTAKQCVGTGSNRSSVLQNRPSLCPQ